MRHSVVPPIDSGHRSNRHRLSPRAARPGTRLLEGDVHFAASLFKDRPFLFIDNAADHGERLRSVLQSLREQATTAMLILGERRNEWRQARIRLRPREYEL